MATIPDITIGDTWVSVNALTGIPAGTEIKIQNKSTTWVLLHESSTQPTTAIVDGELITDLFHEEPSKIVPSGSLEIWAKSTIATRLATLTVQII